MEYGIIILEILACLVVYTLIYEVVRHRIKMRLARRFRRSVRDFIARHDITIERSRLMAKQLVRLDLLEDSQIKEAILKHAQEKNLPLETVIEVVEEYIDEIVPAFNLLSYYKIAYTLARASLHLAYDVVIHKESLSKLQNLPKNAMYVYVMNHRSNADFVLAGYMLSQSICISFAVGEWARIWPLENLFKSFGSYFVRRGFREELYHKILARYLSLITKRGLNQGIFIEGGLSRDGKLRPPKFGLLDYILQASSEEDFSFEDIYFIPTGINFDWVLEDGNLLAEKDGTKKKKPLFFKMFSLMRFLFFLPLVVVTNFFRVIMGRLKRFGYGSVSFGDPISLKEYCRDRDFSHLQGEERKEALRLFSNHLLEKIGRVIPVTPVPLTSYAFLSLDKEEVSKGELLSKIKELRKILLEGDGRLVMGSEFEWYREKKKAMEEEADLRREELLDVDQELVEAEALERTVYLGLDILIRRKILGKRGDQIFLHPTKRDLIEYYANSIGHLFG